MSLKNSLNVNVLRPVLLSDGVVLEDQAGGPHHPVALPQVPPPHMLICDLHDVADREPALLAIRQPDAFIQACRTERKKRKERGWVELGGGKVRERGGGRILGRNKGRLEVSVSFMQEKQLNELLRVEVELEVEPVPVIRVFTQAECKEGGGCVSDGALM